MSLSYNYSFAWTVFFYLLQNFAYAMLMSTSGFKLICHCTSTLDDKKDPASSTGCEVECDEGKICGSRASVFDVGVYATGINWVDLYSPWNLVVHVYKRTQHEATIKKNIGSHCNQVFIVCVINYSNYISSYHWILKMIMTTKKKRRSNNFFMVPQK